MVVAILVFSLVPVRAIAAELGWTDRWQILALLIVSRLILLPLVAGLAYEITVKWAGNHAEQPAREGAAVAGPAAAAHDHARARRRDDRGRRRRGAPVIARERRRGREARAVPSPRRPAPTSRARAQLRARTRVPTALDRGPLAD